MKKIYFARPLSNYNTKQDERDIQLLENLGFEIINPNKEELQKKVDELRNNNPDKDYMYVFTDIVKTCDALAYRSFVDLKISAGVMKEIETAVDLKLPVFELPTITIQRRLSVDETRQYLSYLGQR